MSRVVAMPEQVKGLPRLRAKIWDVFRLLISGDYEEARSSVSQLSQLFLARVRYGGESLTKLVDMLCAAACMSMIGDRYNADALLSSAEELLPLIPLDNAYKEELTGTLLMFKRRHDDAVRHFAEAADSYYHEHVRTKGEISAYKDASFCYVMAEEFEKAKNVIEEFIAERSASAFYEFRAEEDTYWKNLIDLLIEIFSSRRYTLEQFRHVIRCFEKLSRIPETCVWRRFSVIWHKLGEPSIILWPSVRPKPGEELIMPLRPTEAIQPIANLVDLTSMRRRSLIYGFTGGEHTARMLLQLVRGILPSYLTLVERSRMSSGGAFLACERHAGLVSSSFEVGEPANYDVVVEVIVCHRGQKGSLSITVYSDEERAVEGLSAMLDEKIRYHKKTLEECVEPLKDHIYCPNCGLVDISKFRLLSAEKGLVECGICGLHFLVPSYCVELLKKARRALANRGKGGL